MQIPIWRLKNALMQGEGKHVRESSGVATITICRPRAPMGSMKGSRVTVLRAVDWIPSSSTEEVFRELGLELGLSC